MSHNQNVKEGDLKQKIIFREHKLFSKGTIAR